MQKASFLDAEAQKLATAVPFPIYLFIYLFVCLFICNYFRAGRVLGQNRVLERLSSPSLDSASFFTLIRGNSIKIKMHSRSRPGSTHYYVREFLSGSSSGGHFSTQSVGTGWREHLHGRIVKVEEAAMGGTERQTDWTRMEKYGRSVLCCQFDSMLSTLAQLVFLNLGWGFGFKNYALRWSLL